MWVVLLKNYESGAMTNDYPLTPLFILKIVVAMGFAFLGFAVLQRMFVMLAGWFLHLRHNKLGRGEIERCDVLVDDVKVGGVVTDTTGITAVRAKPESFWSAGALMISVDNLRPTGSALFAEPVGQLASIALKTGFNPAARGFGQLTIS